MKPPRGLSAGEAALWRRLTASVEPLRRLDPPLKGEVAPRSGDGGVFPPAVKPLRQPSGLPPPPKGEDRGKTPTLSPDRGLDSSWERKLARAAIAPDFTLDLHGHTLDQAHARLDSGLAQAKAMGARLVLLVTGKARPVDAADRGSRRGAIRAKVLDWLAAGPHGADIAAIRKAHRRHGGDGALYIVLKRRR
ncbi:MAG TPA: Smr/MutS family protein [Croceibacterium sp.]